VYKAEIYSFHRKTPSNVDWKRFKLFLIKNKLILKSADQAGRTYQFP